MTSDGIDPRPASPEEEIIELVRRLHETQERLQELTGGTVDAVLHAGGQAYLLRDAQKKLRLSEAEQRDVASTQSSILNALPANIALIDNTGRIVAINQGWRLFGEENGLQSPDHTLGMNYLDVCDRANGAFAEEAVAVAAGIRAILQRELPEFALVYPCHSPAEHRWFQVIVNPLEDESRGGAVVMHMDVTAKRNAEEALRTSERRQRNLAEELAAERARLLAAQAVAKIGSWMTDLRTMDVIWSEELYRIFDVGDDFRPSHEAFLQKVHPADRKAVSNAFLQSIADGEPCAIEHRIVLADGEVRWIEELWQVFRDEAGEPARAVGTSHDITDRKLGEEELARTYRALQMLSDCNEALIRAGHEQGLLGQICRIAVEGGGYRMAWVGYRGADYDEIIEPQAFAGVEEGYLSEIRISANSDSPSGRGPGGRTVRTGEITITEDVRTAPDFVWRDAALKRGYRSVICLPLRDAERVFGILALYSADVARLGEDEVRLLQQLADDLAFGIVNLRSGVERARIESAVVRLAAGVSAASGSDFFAGVAINMARAADAHAAFVARLLPKGPLRARTIGAAVKGRLVENFDFAVADTPCERLLAEDELFLDSGFSADPFPLTPGGAFAGRLLRDSSGRPAGFLFVLFSGPIRRSALLSSTLSIFATRVAAELEREHADANLREQASMLDAATDAIFVFDLEHRITYWNRSAERLYGWTAAEAIGASTLDLLHGDDQDSFLAAHASVLARGYWSGEVRRKSRAGIELAIESRWTLMADDRGRPKSVLAINTDVTERKKLEAQFLRAQRMESIGTLAGGIAHDLNNLLAPIVMGVSVIRRFENRENILSIISNIERSAKRGTDLVKQVLSFGRGLEGARLPLRLADVVSEIEAIVASTFPKNIRFVRRLPSDVSLVIGDPTQLHQVLLNLCVNARDAMPDGGTLSISVANVEIDEQYGAMKHGASPGSYVVMDVADEGQGMSRDIMDRMFDPFFTTKEAGKGTGLGLSTVLGIVRNHGGFIDVYSEPGSGSSFKVYLPVAENGTVASPAGDRVDGLPHGNGELILVVDDELSVRSITSQTLDAFGYRTLVAEDGAQAIGLYAIHRDEIALVITDMMMPVMDGPALVAALCRIDPQVRIIGASGLGSSENVVRAKHAGLEHFLAKPFSADTLLTLIRDVLAERAGDRVSERRGGLE